MEEKWFVGVILAESSTGCPKQALVHANYNLAQWIMIAVDATYSGVFVWGERSQSVIPLLGGR